MLKIIGYVFLGLVATIAIGATIFVGKFNKRFFKEKPNYLTYSYGSDKIQFQWAARQFEDHFEPHQALIIPVTIEGVARKFRIQFDTGTPHSTIYEKPLESLIAQGVKFETEGEKGKRMAKNIQLSLGGNKVDFASIKILENYGRPIDWQDSTTVIGLGTIGADFIDGKVTAIDFKNQIIRLYEERPHWMSSLSGFESFDFQGRRLMLPAEIGKRKRQLLYDSGCSAFGMITSKNRFKRYSDKNAKEIAYGGNSWGATWPIHHKASQTILKMGGSELPLQRISYVDLYGNLQRFMTPFTRIGGFLGNKPFLESTLVLDTKVEEFIVLDSTVAVRDTAR